MGDAKVLTQWLAQEEDQLKRLMAQRERVDTEIAKVQQKVSLLKNLMALQTNSYGGHQTALPAVKGRFSGGVALRDATLTVLREQQRAPLDKIVEALIAGGFDFDGRSPRRVVFITLTNLIRSKNGDSSVRKERDDFIYVEKEG